MSIKTDWKEPVPGIDGAKQEEKEYADINKIMNTVNSTGMMPVGSELGKQAKAFFGDFSEVTDYASCREAAERLEGAFMALPAKARNRFDNNPDKLLEFIEKKENLEEAIELGIVEKPKGWDHGQKIKKQREAEGRKGLKDSVPEQPKDEGAPESTKKAE